MHARLIGELLDTVSKAVINHAEELTALDQAIGDGDHGINMTRGFEAVQAAREDLTGKPLNEALQAAGMQLVMRVGGASGPLYGTLLMTLGKQLGPHPPDRRALATAFASAVAAVQARGKSRAGQKTLLDVLIPLQEALSREESIARLREIVAEAVSATRDMRATRGRASFLGERSVGHIDPGARSSQLMFEAVVAVLEAHHDS